MKHFGIRGRRTNRTRVGSEALSVTGMPRQGAHRARRIACSPPPPSGPSPFSVQSRNTRHTLRTLCLWVYIVQTSVQRTTSINSKLSGFFQRTSFRNTHAHVFYSNLRIFRIVIYRDSMSVASFSTSTFRLLTVDSRGYTLFIQYLAWSDMAQISCSTQVLLNLIQEVSRKILRNNISGFYISYRRRPALQAGAWLWRHYVDNIRSCKHQGIPYYSFRSRTRHQMLTWLFCMSNSNIIQNVSLCWCSNNLEADDLEVLMNVVILGIWSTANSSYVSRKLRQHWIYSASREEIQEIRL